MTFSAFTAANEALGRGEYQTAILGYGRQLGCSDGLEEDRRFNLTIARNRYRRSRRNERPRIAACGWEMGHNSAGRVRTLADIYAASGDVSMIGALFPHWGGRLWEPLAGSPYPCHFLPVENGGDFPSLARDFVLAHPFDTVHLSKPRMPNILFGLFYKLFWDARVILDIDDEELGIMREERSLDLAQSPQRPDGRPDWSDITGKTWTRIAVGLSQAFEQRTVSNSALKARYGGLVLPHARSERQFRSSPERRRASRSAFGLPQDRTIVLFFGTVRRHKGVIETAEAVRALGRGDLCFVVAGDIPDAGLAAELAAMAGPDLCILPMQGYDHAADIVICADICVLLQNEMSLLAQYQLPAKLIDALAGGLIVLAQPTPAMGDLIAAGAVLPTAAATLTTDLSRCLDDPVLAARLRRNGRNAFEEKLSISAQQPLVAGLLRSGSVMPPGKLLPRGLQDIFDRLL